jgi:hypothetical protein
MSIYKDFLDEALFLIKEADIEPDTFSGAPDSATDTLPVSPNAVTTTGEEKPSSQPPKKNEKYKSKKKPNKLTHKELKKLNDNNEEESKEFASSIDHNKEDSNLLLKADDLSEIKNGSLDTLFKDSSFMSGLMDKLGGGEGWGSIIGTAGTTVAKGAWDAVKGEAKNIGGWLAKNPIKSISGAYAAHKLLQRPQQQPLPKNGSFMSGLMDKLDGKD